jgi:hypothetical protein
MTPDEQVEKLAVMTAAEHLALSYSLAANASDSVSHPNGRAVAVAFAGLHVQWAVAKAARVTSPRQCSMQVSERD